MHHRNRHPAALVVAMALAAALAATGCSSSGTGAGSADPASSSSTPIQTTSTPPPPQPITAAEKHWIHAIRAYSQRLNRNVNSSGVLTETSLRSMATIDTACRSTLHQAGDPGRFAPAKPMVERACRILRLSSHQVNEMLASGAISGGVVVGDFSEFNSSLSAVYNHQGNAANVLQHALAKATTIRGTFGPA